MSKISQEELKSLRASFDKYDVSKDGKLQAPELEKLFADLQVKDAKQEAASLLKKFDVNHDGDITYGEFLRGYIALREASTDHAVPLNSFVSPATSTPATATPTPAPATPTPTATPTKTKKLHKFEYHAPNYVREVQLAGYFNDWHGQAMQKVGDKFELEVELAPGHHEYKFKSRPSHEHGRLDEHWTWHHDHGKPHHHDKSGHQNNTLEI